MLKQFHKETVFCEDFAHKVNFQDKNEVKEVF